MHVPETAATIDMMGAERGAGANTLAAYRRDLMDFAQVADLRQASRDQGAAEGQGDKAGTRKGHGRV